MKVISIVAVALFLAACEPAPDPVMVECDYNGTALQVDPLTDPAFCGVDDQCLGGMACIPGLSECVDGECVDR